MVIDAQATPLMARELIRRIRGVTSKPIRYVVLTHYQAVRVLGASAYKAEHIIASESDARLDQGKEARPTRKARSAASRGFSAAPKLSRGSLGRCSASAASFAAGSLLR
jgi:glyoxylase-like metal-dependent hydrolase (beta-lactamase superfamily II)